MTVRDEEVVLVPLLDSEITLHQPFGYREVSILDAKTYEVTGVVIDKHDTPHYSRVQVEAASADKTAKTVKSKLRIRRGDLFRDVSIKEIR